MGRRAKLSAQHVNQIHYLAATGIGPTEIARALAQGVTIEGGSTLAPVEIDESLARYYTRSSEGKTAIQAWREQIHGNVYNVDMAWIGCRVKELAEIFSHAKERAVQPADSTRAAEVACQRWARVAISAADSIRNELAGLAPREGATHAHLHLHNQEQPELVAVLGARLTELARAGLLEDAAKLLSGGPQTADLEPIETTAVDAPMEQSAAAPMDEPRDPRPPPSAQSAAGT